VGDSGGRKVLAKGEGKNSSTRTRSVVSEVRDEKKEKTNSSAVKKYSAKN